MMTEPLSRSSKGKTILRTLLFVGGWFLFLIGVVAVAAASMDLVAEEPEDTLAVNYITQAVGLILGALGFLAMSKLEVGKGLLKSIGAITEIGGLWVITSTGYELMTLTSTVSRLENVVLLDGKPVRCA